MKDCPWRKFALLHVIHVKDVAGEGTEVKQFSLRSSHVSMFGGHRLDHPARVYCKLASMWMIRDAAIEDIEGNAGI